jgi:GT2 family glycosyltransferase
MQDVTIILPNYNNERVLPFTFAALRARIDCASVHFLMVDDGSEDRSVAVAKTEAMQCGFASVRIEETPHRGIVFALNDALAHVRTDLIVRIDGDATVESNNWLARMLAVLRHDEVGIVGGQVIWESGRVHSFGRSVFSDWGLYDMGACPLEPIGQRTFDSIVHRPFTQFVDGPPYEVDTVLGVCVAFRRADAEAVRGFDQRFNPVWIEDDDFGLAIRALGKRIVIDPAIQIVHRPSLRGSRQPGEESKRQAASNGTASRGQRLTPARVRRALPALADRGRAAVRALRGHRPPRPEFESFFPREERGGWRADLLTRHYAAWRDKWGFDPINPDVHAVMRRYWDGAFCWRLNPAQQARSQAFLQQLAEQTS